jgi:glutaminyl-peptide cyclotransferase
VDEATRTPQHVADATRRELLKGLGIGAASLLLPTPVAWNLAFPGQCQAAGLTASQARARVAGQDGPTERLFDRDRAWAHLVNQVDAGPRVPNTPGHAACREYLLRQLGEVCDRVDSQDFVWDVRGTPLRMSNVFGVVGADRPKKVLLTAHWDTRPWADQDPNPANHMTPIPGANDGASGVAILLEVARVLREARPQVGVLIVCLDGEDYGPGIDAMFLGSRYYAQNVVPERPAWGILLDMVGDRELVIEREQISETRAPDVNRRVFAAAREVGRSEFADRTGQSILDDHVPLLDAGLPVVDLIDFSYGPGHRYWHTLEDTPDKCSPASLEAVGQVVLRTVLNEPG